MIIEPKQTTLAYRCPSCGAGVISAVGMFSVAADLLKLKCDCGKSEMEVAFGSDGKVRLTVPCLTCAAPHRFTLNRSLFYGKELFTLSCPYSNLNVAALGEINQVKAEMARGELELLDLLEKNGISDPAALQGEEELLPDPQIREIVLFVIHELDAEGKIFCRCEGKEERSYDVSITNEGILVSCAACGASRLIPTDSSLGAHAFLHADALYLE